MLYNNMYRHVCSLYFLSTFYCACIVSFGRGKHTSRYILEIEQAVKTPDAHCSKQQTNGKCVF